MEDSAIPIVENRVQPQLGGDLSLDTRSRQAHDLDRVQIRAAEYGQHQWQQLEAAGHHRSEIAPDPAADTDAGQLLTEPAGPNHDAGWGRRRLAYEAVTLVLAGPHRDSGSERHEAARRARRRRGAGHASARTFDLAQITTAQYVLVTDQLSAVAVIGDPDPDTPALDNRASPARVVPPADGQSGPSLTANRTPLHVGRAPTSQTLLLSALISAGVVVSRAVLRPRTATPLVAALHPVGG